jgi:release factor glutamine methyltransferase
VSVSESLADAARALSAAGVPDPERDAERLLRHALGWDAATLLARSRDQLHADALGRFARLVAERGRRVPLQHIIGAVEFWRREFLVSPAALIPRPETELLVEHALRALAGQPSPVVVDVGTGSGCIALSLAAERPDAQVHALDVSSAALALALENARRLGVADRVEFRQGDLLAPLAEFAGRVDLIASNPPYLDASEMPRLAPEVRGHEPQVALLPPDGDRYSVYRRLAPQARKLLRDGGSLLLEIGLGMEREVRAIGEGAGLAVEDVLPDLQGIPRLVIMAAGGRR